MFSYKNKKLVTLQKSVQPGVSPINLKLYEKLIYVKTTTKNDYQTCLDEIILIIHYTKINLTNTINVLLFDMISYMMVYVIE